ncbi:hypothetical protein C4K12_3227 [Pseudomonas chlororaphis subsp. aureofaciens]|jgi:hypothetical protein|nr:hypothetical protein C4K12_3227 [Pseudomonas chlororaphis subsp. aureofaciens]
MAGIVQEKLIASTKSDEDTSSETLFPQAIHEEISLLVPVPVTAH